MQYQQTQSTYGEVQVRTPQAMDMQLHEAHVQPNRPIRGKVVVVSDLAIKLYTYQRVVASIEEVDVKRSIYR